MICRNCTNFIQLIDAGKPYSFCKWEDIRRDNVTQCSHFEEKPKNYSEQSKKAEELVKTGKFPRKQPKKNIYYD